MWVVVPFSCCLALSLGIFRGRRGGSLAGAGNLAVIPPAAVVLPAVVVVFPVRASLSHRPVPPALLLPQEAHFPILIFAGCSSTSWSAWLLIGLAIATL